MEDLEKQIKDSEAAIKQADTFDLDPNYLNRLYNTTKIKAERARFEAILVREGGYTPQEAAQKTNSILNGKAFIPIDDELTGMARGLKERQLVIDDIYIEDFLESNIASVGRYYSTRMGADVELVKQFGSIDLREVINRIKDGYNFRIDRIDPDFVRMSQGAFQAFRQKLGKQVGIDNVDKTIRILDEQPPAITESIKRLVPVAAAAKGAIDNLNGVLKEFTLGPGKFATSIKSVISELEKIEAKIVTKTDDAVDVSEELLFIKGDDFDIFLGSIDNSFKKIQETLAPFKSTGAKQAKGFIKALRVQMKDVSKSLHDPKFIKDAERSRSKFTKELDEARRQDTIPNVRTNKEALKLEKERDQVVEDFLAMRDRIRGTYGIPDDPTSWTNRGIRVAKMWNAVSLLTGALAAVPDLGKLIFSDGVKRTFGIAAEAFQNDLRGTLALAKDEANLAGEALDMYISMRSALFADLADSLSAATPLERRMGNATQQFFNISLMNQWNESVKTMASLITGSRIIEESANWAGGTISKLERTKLSNVGIDRRSARIISEQTEKHGMTGDRVRIAKTHLWDQTDEVQEARRAYTGALGKEINRIIVTPGSGEIPLFMSKPLMTLLFQFKTFAISATHRTLTPGLQLKDQNFMMGNIALFGLGALVNEIRQHQLSKGKRRNQKFGDWVTSSIERGGNLGFISDMNQMLETLTDNRVGVRPLLGAARPYNSTQAKIGVFGGPIVQQVSNVGRVLWDIGPGDADDQTSKALRRISYLGSTFWADGIFDVVEDGANALFEE